MMNIKYPSLTFLPFLVGVLLVLAGCESARETLRTKTREFYLGNSLIVSRQDNGFIISCPKSWGLITEAWLDGTNVDTGMMIGVVDYEWSPVVQFNKLGAGVKRAEDIARLDADLSSRQELQQIQVTEVLTSFNKFAGHGLRKVGTSRGRRSEFILFYPDGEMAGTRILVLLSGSPNEVSLKELDGVIRSVSFNKN